MHFDLLDGMDDYADSFVAENSALRRKLQSKVEALLILSQELDQCRTERDQFKVMAEQLHNRCSSLKKTPSDLAANCRLAFLSDDCGSNQISGNVSQALAEAREQNKALKLEVEDLKQKICDTQGDIKVLRAGQSRYNGNYPVGMSENVSALAGHQKEALVQQLEHLAATSGQLRAELQAALDENEELATERDIYKEKAHRLNHQIATLLKTDTNQFIDIDALVMENRYLQECLSQAQAEKELSQQALKKYKSMLDIKRNRGIVKLGSNSSATGMVVSHKQVQQLLERGTSAELPNTDATLADLKSLCMALLEALQDKILVLSHQKKANKILAGRMTELEERLCAVKGFGITPFPSQLLLEGYKSAQINNDPHGSDAGSDNSPPLSPTSPSADLIANVSEQNAAANNGDSLPPDLQELVKKALQEIKNETTILTV